MHHERIVGIAISVLGLATFFVLIPAGIVVPDSVDIIVLSPDFWPKVVAAIFTLCGLVMFFKQTQEGPEHDEIPLASRLPRLAIALLALFSFYYAIPYLGMVFPAIVLIFGMMFFSGERRWVLMTIIAIAAPLLLYLFFAHVANIPIPLGLFEALRG